MTLKVSSYAQRQVATPSLQLVDCWEGPATINHYGLAARRLSRSLACYPTLIRSYSYFATSFLFCKYEVKYDRKY